MRVEFQQSARMLTTDDFALVSFMLRRDDPIEILVNPLMVIVLEIRWMPFEPECRIAQREKSGVR